MDDEKKKLTRAAELQATKGWDAALNYLDNGNDPEKTVNGSVWQTYNRSEVIFKAYTIIVLGFISVSYLYYINSFWVIPAGVIPGVLFTIIQLRADHSTYEHKVCRYGHHLTTCYMGFNILFLLLKLLVTLDPTKVSHDAQVWGVFACIGIAIGIIILCYYLVSKHQESFDI